MRIQKGDKPEAELGGSANGMYVAFCDELHLPRPTKKLLMYINGRWGYPGGDQFYRGLILGYIGPLPSPTVDELIGVSL